ncbi:hypothetical protein CMI37_37185 [Candidatus Pacearchaeota archaeon]|nr:hypothetical protein [Candidatus Pacearchaeota archaeon]|tara:strand:+ start:424 stop:723 length:300 start_codon:yes stop_codon:yes gene_type:complete
MPITLNSSFALEPSVVETCWNWCSEQAMIHQSNIDISNLGIVAVAMVALLIYNLSVEFQDELVEKLEIERSKLIFYGHVLVYFAFIILAVFLAYYAWFN